MTDNFLDVLEFDNYGEADKFASRHRCGICMSRIFPVQTKNRTFNIECPIHGIIITGGAIHVSKINEFQQADWEREKEERIKELMKEKPVDDRIYKELGF